MGEGCGAGMTLPANETTRYPGVRTWHTVLVWRVAMRALTSHSEDAFLDPALEASA
jgi:hypothetical protein